MNRNPLDASNEFPENTMTIERKTILTAVLALALAPRNIKVVAVAPGWVMTDMTRAFLESPEGAEIRAQSPHDRTATVDEVAEVVLLAVSGRADALAGGIIDVHHQRSGSAEALKRSHIERISSSLAEVLRRSDECQRPTNEIAEQLAEEYLAESAGCVRAPLAA